MNKRHFSNTFYECDTDSSECFLAQFYEKVDGICSKKYPVEEL